MPLLLPPAPATARRSVLAALRSDPHRVPAPTRPGIALPVHEITGVRAAGRGRTTLTGWRFLLAPASEDAGAQGMPVGEGAGRSGTVASADVVSMGDDWAFTHVSRGPYVLSTVRALAQAEALPLSCQPRLLSVPELYMVTLWLHKAPDADPAAGSPAPYDLLIPLSPAPPGIVSHRPQRVDALLPVLTDRLTSAKPLRAGTRPAARTIAPARPGLP